MPPTLDRRGFLSAAGLGVGAGWLAPLGTLLARQEEASRSGGPASSLILLWLAGGPSQLETFDPHPGTAIGGRTRAIETAAPGVRIASGFGNLAGAMGDVAIVRSLVSKEGDHERGSYLLKTGYRPDPTVDHPSIGAICCHELPVGSTDIPRHVSILAGQWPGRGGFLGGEYDAFLVDDPRSPLADVRSPVPSPRDEARARDLAVVDGAFGAGRGGRVGSTLHGETLRRARVMMTSDQLRAFDVTREPTALVARYGDTPFGRACLAARRLIEVGVRCVEVTLEGWDTHANNHEIQARRVADLDPAFAALIGDLKAHGLLGRTVVACGGEFGRSPKINPLGGRDHWPTGFSMALAGGGIRGGLALGATDPEGRKGPDRPTPVEDVHATIYRALGIDVSRENIAPNTGRPIKIGPGRAIPELIG